MRLATIRTPSGTAAVRIDDEAAVHLGAPDVGALLADPGWRARAAGAAGEAFDPECLDYAPLVPRPEKIICVGLNYRDHIQEMGHEAPDHPTLFAKFTPALIGAHDPITLPAASSRVDWEAELTVVIGAEVRHADRETAAQAIAGYTVANDVSARDWQRRTTQFLQGKTFEATTPLGPHLVTAEPGDGDPQVRVVGRVGDDVVQDGHTGQLIFGPNELVRYVSTICTLRPGDVILTGTPAGVGDGRTPPRYLQPGEVLTTTIDGIGSCVNRCQVEG